MKRNLKTGPHRSTASRPVDCDSSRQLPKAEQPDSPQSEGFSFLRSVRRAYRQISLVLVGTIVLMSGMYWYSAPSSGSVNSGPLQSTIGGQFEVILTNTGTNASETVQSTGEKPQEIQVEADQLEFMLWLSRQKLMPEDELELADRARQIAQNDIEPTLATAPSTTPTTTIPTPTKPAPTTTPPTKPTAAPTTTPTATTAIPTTAPTSAPTTTSTTVPTSAPTEAESVRADGSTDRIVGYYAAWKALEGYTPSQIDASKMTHLLYAFANISSDLKITMGYPKIDPENFAQLRELKEQNPQLQTMISIGGWDWSGRFSDAALTRESRAKFADSCVAFIVQHGFDGVDVDWEYPVQGGASGMIHRPEDKQNFTHLMESLRFRLDKQSKIDGRPYLLSFSGGCLGTYANNTELDELGSLVDFASVMTYDFHGKWDARTDFNAPLYAVSHSPRLQIIWSIDDTIDLWLDHGMPAEKLVMGIPFYGMKYTNVTSTDNNGFYQDFDTGWSISYRDIAEKYLSNDMPRYFHPVAKVPWLFDGQTFISYEDPESIAYKVDYIQDRGLGGAMFWQITQDDGTLLDALHDELN